MRCLHSFSTVVEKEVTVVWDGWECWWRSKQTATGETGKLRLMLDEAAQNCTVVLSRRIVMNFWTWQKKGDFWPNSNLSEYIKSVSLSGMVVEGEKLRTLRLWPEFHSRKRNRNSWICLISKHNQSQDWQTQSLILINLPPTHTHTPVHTHFPLDK